MSAKYFFLWVLLIGGFTFGYGKLTESVLSQNPVKTAVLIDTSFEMKKAEDRIRERLLEISKRRYRNFYLLTDKELLLSDSPVLDPTIQFKFYGSFSIQDLADINRYPFLKTAKEIIVITDNKNSKGIQQRIPGATVIELN